MLAILVAAMAIVGATALPAMARNVNDTHSYSDCKYNYQLKDHGLGKEIGYAALFWVQVFPQGSGTWSSGSGCKLKLRVLYKQPQSEDWAVANWVYTANRRNGDAWTHSNSRASVGLMRVIATVCKGNSCSASKVTTAQQ